MSVVIIVIVFGKNVESNNISDLLDYIKIVTIRFGR